jgi:hypothetical protein
MAPPAEALVFGLRGMRAASRDFLDSVERDGNSTDEIILGQLLGIYQARIGQQLAPLAELTEVEVDSALVNIMPPEDLDWMPGFQ